MKAIAKNLAGLYARYGAEIDRLCEYFDNLGQLHGLTACEDANGREYLELVFVHGIVSVPDLNRFWPRDELVVRHLHTIDGPDN